MSAKRLVFLTLWVPIVACSSPPEAKAPDISLNHDLRPDERSAIDDIVGEARVVTFGEVAHRLVEAHDFALALFHHLVTAHTFRVLFVESSWHLADRLEHFMTTDVPNVPQSDLFYLNAFSSPQMTDLLRYVREYNELNPNDKIYVAGMQPENPVSDARSILEWLETAGQSPDDSLRVATESLQRIADSYDEDLDFVIQAMTQDSVNPLDEETRQELLDHIAELEPHLANPSVAQGETASPDMWLHAQLSLLSLEAYLRYLVPFARALRAGVEGPEMENIRRFGYAGGDRTRATIVRSLLDTKYTGLRAMIWVHDWHAAKQSAAIGSDHPAVPPPDTESLGTHLERWLNDAHVVLGSVAVTGRDEADQALDVVFERLLGDRRTVINFADTIGSWNTLPLREPRTLIVEPTLDIHLINVVLTDQFDGVVYFPSWTSAGN